MRRSSFGRAREGNKWLVVTHSSGYQQQEMRGGWQYKMRMRERQGSLKCEVLADEILTSKTAILYPWLSLGSDRPIIIAGM
jgi:hypothetical protein